MRQDAGRGRGEARVRNGTIAALAFWALLLGGSLAWNLWIEDRAMLRQAVVEANAHFNSLLVFRRWVAGHGGVYAPASEETPPHPLLVQVGEKDLLTLSGRRLTLINPSYMTRQVVELSGKEYGVRGHLTSLKVLRPGNEPDAWERTALSSFEAGRPEAFVIERTGGEPYLRFMRPLVTEKSCLECHAAQGYAEGGVRGGISISVPMAGYYAARRQRFVKICIGHSFIWLCGACGILAGARLLRLRIRESERARKALVVDQERFRSLLELTQMKDATERELVDFALEEVIRLSGSRVGYFHFYEESERSLRLTAWSAAVRKECSLAVETRYPLEKAGVWADCIRERKPVVHNDYPALRERKGCPEGHIPVFRQVSVPVMDGERVVAVFGVGNKEEPYDEGDVLQLTLYAASLGKILSGRRDEAVLRAGEERYRTIFETSGLSLWEEDCGGVLRLFADLRAEGVADLRAHIASHPEFVDRAAGAVKILDVNQATLDIYRAGSKGELLGSLGKILTPESQAAFRDQLIAIWEGRSRFQAEAVNHTLDGERLDILISTVFPPDPARSTRMVVSVADITELRKTREELEKYRANLEERVRERTDALEAKTRDLERSQMAMQYLLEDVNEAKRQLESANERLKELDRLKSMFIASMSHELRTPLNSIIGFTGILLQGMAGELNGEQKDQLERVFRAGKHLLSLITDVIDIAKIESGKIQPYVEEFQLQDLVHEACESLRVQLEDKGLELRADLPEAPVKMKTDRRRLLQCLLNYLGNAAKFTVRGSIAVSASVEGERVTLSVADTGIGIKASNTGLLFISFVRLDSPLKMTTPGTGLGLYLTKKLVTEVLGGEVFAESAEGVGSTFSLTIPRVLPAEEQIG
ncbi:MAG TPA: GAF domain-containing protein [Candidatus Methanoperedens sp.]|nr:GAF domain-containing protein [Candidatus Methanoperedens sp.]